MHLLADWSNCEEFPVPDKTGDFRAHVRVEIDDDVIFEEEKDIKIKKPKLITLVQTDKPIYKPGQTGKDPGTVFMLETKISNQSLGRPTQYYTASIHVADIWFLSILQES